MPGTHAWRAQWAELFAAREVTVIMDCDRPGRQAAARIGRDLHAHGARVRLVDLAPERDDGYDLSDWLRQGNSPRLLTARRLTGEAYTRIASADGDVFTVRATPAQPASAGAARPGGEAALGVVSPGGGGRRLGCAAF